MPKTQWIRAASVIFLVPAMMGADGDGCSGEEPIGSDNPPPSISNPTGSCTAEGDGAHECYSVPDPDSRWMLDCNHPLDRTYWRVYAYSEQSAHMVPRPDATGLTFGICGGNDPALEALFAKYDLCSEMLGSAGVDKVNDMPLADALAISHALHERLEFSGVDKGDGNGWIFEPWVPPADMRDACEVAAKATGDSDLQAQCDAYVDTACGPTAIGVILNLEPDQANALIDALHGLYGIE